MDSSERVHLQTHLVPGRWFSAEEYIRLLRFHRLPPQIHNHHRTKGHHPDHLCGGNSFRLSWGCGGEESRTSADGLFSDGEGVEAGALSSINFFFEPVNTGISSQGGISPGSLPAAEEAVLAATGEADGTWGSGLREPQP